MYHRLFGIMTVPKSCFLMTKATSQFVLLRPKVEMSPVLGFCTLRRLAIGLLLASDPVLNFGFTEPQYSDNNNNNLRLNCYISVISKFSACETNNDA